MLFEIQVFVVFVGITPEIVWVNVDTPRLCVAILIVEVACVTSWTEVDRWETPIPGYVKIQIQLASVIINASATVRFEFWTDGWTCGASTPTTEINAPIPARITKQWAGCFSIAF
jgi:hypothetical protein